MSAPVSASASSAPSPHAAEPWLPDGARGSGLVRTAIATVARSHAAPNDHPATWTGVEATPCVRIACVIHLAPSDGS